MYVIVVRVGTMRVIFIRVFGCALTIGRRAPAVRVTSAVMDASTIQARRASAARGNVGLEVDIAARALLEELAKQPSDHVHLLLLLVAAGVGDTASGILTVYC
jgi:hypothetical protein